MAKLRFSKPSIPKPSILKSSTLTSSIPIVTILSLSTILCACNLVDKLETATIRSNNPAVINDPSKPDKPALEDLQLKLSDLQTQIENSIGNAACTDSKQCGALPMGKKACGGPQGYLPYSTIDTDTTSLFELSDQHQRTSGEINQMTGAISDCMVTSQPVIICRDNRCQNE